MKCGICGSKVNGTSLGNFYCRTCDKIVPMVNESDDKKCPKCKSFVNHYFQYFRWSRKIRCPICKYVLDKI